jgi:hypothetical protein
MSNPGLLWELFIRTARGAPLVVSSNWAAYLISAFLFVFLSLWRFLADSSLPWRERVRDVWEGKKTDILRGSVMLLIFWAILFSASFAKVLDEERSTLRSLKNDNQQLLTSNTTMQKQNSDLTRQLSGLAITESPTSLRRRTIKLVNDLNAFWSRRPAPLQPVQSPTTDEERKRNAIWDKYWRDVEADYANAIFRDRLLGIIREYRGKGIPTGYMEQAFEQPNRFVGSAAFGGPALEDCLRFMNDLCLVRELAYHVDASDKPIILTADLH